MVDRLRAYRRWRNRKLALLLPVLLAALATQLWLAAGSAAPVWLRVVSLAASGLILVLVGAFFVQTLRCSTLQTRGHRAPARLLREQLAPSGRAVLAAAALLAVLGVAPDLVPSIPERTRSSTTSRRPLPRLPRKPLDPAAESPLAADPVESPVAAAPPPELEPIAEKLPLRLIEESESAPDFSAAGILLDGLSSSPQESRNGNESEGFPGYRSNRQDGVAFTFESRSPLFARLGVPREGQPEEWLPPEMRLEASFLGRGNELSFFLDVPIGRNESLVTSVSVGRLNKDEFLEASSPETWERVIIAYSQRVAGHTLHAVVDLSFTVGASLDRYQLAGHDGPVDPRARLSPYVAVDAALWQQSSTGLILHAAYSVPLNAIGASSGVLDLSASLKIDLTDSISVRVGYRYLLFRLREFEGPFDSEETSAGLAERFSGPVVGIDFRF